MNCLICKEQFAEAIELKCGHAYCNNCFTTWYKSNKRVCCYCFAPFEYSDYFELSYSDLNAIEVGILLVRLMKEGNLEEIGKVYLETKYTHIMYFASSSGYLEVVRYLHEVVGAKYTDCAIDYASKNGHLEVVKFLHEVVGIPCTEDTIDYARKKGHLEVVRYLRKKCS